MYIHFKLIFFRLWETKINQIAKTSLLSCELKNHPKITYLKLDSLFLNEGTLNTNKKL